MTNNRKFLITTLIAVLSIIATLYAGFIGGTKDGTDTSLTETNTVNGSNNIVVIGENASHVSITKPDTVTSSGEVKDWFSSARREVSFINGFYAEPIFPFEETQKTEWFHHGTETLAGCWFFDTENREDIWHTLNTTLFLRLKSDLEGLGVRFGNKLGDIAKDENDYFVEADLAQGAYFDADGSVRYLNYSWKRVNENELEASHEVLVVGAPNEVVRNLYKMIECP